MKTGPVAEGDGAEGECVQAPYFPMFPMKTGSLSESEPRRRGLRIPKPRRGKLIFPVSMGVEIVATAITRRWTD
jgi:hypothetical protein